MGSKWRFAVLLVVCNDVVARADVKTKDISLLF
jgi:hypothetical protein